MKTYEYLKQTADDIEKSIMIPSQTKVWNSETKEWEITHTDKGYEEHMKQAREEQLKKDENNEEV